MNKKNLIFTIIVAIVAMVLVVIATLVINNAINYQQCLSILGVENVTFEDVQERIERTCNAIFMR